jgi:hypothetical protein
MLKVDQYAKIRVAHRDGMSIHQIAKTFRHSRRKVRDVLANSQPAPYVRTKPAPAPVLGAFHAIIDSILAADEEAPPKQRHTAMQLYRRLRDEYQYTGQYDPVRRYIGKPTARWPATTNRSAFASRAIGPPPSDPRSPV